MAPAHVSAQGILREMAARPAAEKVQPELRVALEEGRAPERTLVQIQSATKLDLSRYADWVHQFTWPAGEHVAMLWIDPAHAERIAGLPGVAKVQWADPDFVEAYAAQIPVVDPELAPAPWVGVEGPELREIFDNAPSWAETEALLAEQAAAEADEITGAASGLGDGAASPASRGRDRGLVRQPLGPRRGRSLGDGLHGQGREGRGDRHLDGLRPPGSARLVGRLPPRVTATRVGRWSSTRSACSA